MSRPGAWSAKGIAISLSAARREALKAFAESSSSGEALTPAQALYSLIDLIDPADAEAVAGFGDDGAMAGASPPDETKPNPRDAILVGGDPLSGRLLAIESRLDELTNAMASCAQAMESVAAALAPIQVAMAARSPRAARPDSLKNASQRPAPAERLALPPKEWLVAAVAPNNRQAGGPVTAALALISQSTAYDGSVRFRFGCERWPDSSHSFSKAGRWPDLLVIERADGPLALSVAIEPRAPFSAVFSWQNGAWIMRIGRRGEHGAAGPALYRSAA